MTNIIRRISLTLLFVLAVTVQSAFAVPQTRLDRLAKGVNVPHWFWAAPERSPEYIKTYFTEADAKIIRDAGLRHIRLPVERELLFDWDAPEKLKDDNVKLLEDAIRLLNKSGLAVIVTPFGDFQSKAATEEGIGDAERFWAVFGKRFSAFDPEMVYLEVTNEPDGVPKTWFPLQERLIKVMRTAAPKHTIITANVLKSGLEPETWSSVDAFVQMKPVRDNNVVYNLHFYEPFWFTHQGAEWAPPAALLLKQLPYPSTPQNVEKLADELFRTISDERMSWVPSMIRDYGRDQWNTAKIDAKIRQVADWSKAHGGVPVTINEFGVYRKVVKPEARLRWIRDVRKAAEKHKIGWSMWDYSGGFYLASGEKGSRKADRATVDALTK